MKIKEQLVKTVVKSGNGGAVWAPKRWLGQKVVIILPEKQKLSLKERIMEILMPYMENISAAFLYGSYARNEQTSDSDIDILIIADKKFKITAKNKFEINVFSLEQLKEIFEKNPVYYQIIREAKPIINASLLNKLKEIRINTKSFRYFLETTKDHIKSNGELLELDALDSKLVLSSSVIYSLMVRLRGIYILKCIKEDKSYSKHAFRKWILGHNVSKAEYERAYKIYSFIRDDKNPKNLKFSIASAFKLLKRLKKETVNLKIHGEQKKKAAKRDRIFRETD